MKAEVLAPRMALHVRETPGAGARSFVDTHTSILCYIHVRVMKSRPVQYLSVTDSLDLVALTLKGQDTFIYNRIPFSSSPTSASS